MTVIRDAGPEDAETLQKIYDWYVRNTAVTFEYETPTAAQFRERMERTMERYPYLIAETDGRADGYCYAGPFVGRAAYDWSAAPRDGNPQSVCLHRSAPRGGCVSHEGQRALS